MKPEFDALVKHLLDGNIFLEEAIELLERKMIEGALERTGNTQILASKRLGIHRNTLQRKMVQYQLGHSRPRRKPVVRVARTRKPKSGVA